MSYTGSALDGNVFGVHPIDNAKLRDALGGRDPFHRDADGGVLQEIRTTSTQLMTPMVLPETDKSRPVASPTWGKYILGVGEVVFRAFSPVVPERDREYLLAFLEEWARTVFADPTADLRIWLTDSRTPVTIGYGGNAISIVGDARMARFVGHGRSPLEPNAQTSVEFVWGDAPQLQAFVGLVRERGPVAWDPEAPRVLAELTGLSRPASVVVLAGYLGWADRLDSALDSQQRAFVGISKAETADVIAELRSYGIGDVTRLLTEVLPSDPALLWQPNGLRVLASRLAQVWVDRYGCRAAVPESTIAAAIDVYDELKAGCYGVPSAAELCATVADSASSTLLTCLLDSSAKKFNDAGQYASTDARNVAEFENFWRPLIETCRWAYAFLPVGDPVHDGVPATIERLRAQLRQPGLTLGVGTVIERTIVSIRHRRKSDPWPQAPEADRFDDGLMRATDDGRDNGWNLRFRPSNYLLDDRTRDLRAMVHPFYRGPLDYLDWVFGQECDRMIARIASGKPAKGAFEIDPAFSAPDLVAEVGHDLDIDPDAAALYLQLATLIAPSDRNIRRWNGWKPARHRAAETALLDKGLVVRDKRGRAGRSVFVPGTWIKKPGIEQWKWELHGLENRYREKFFRGASTPRTCMPDLFRVAWQHLGDAAASTTSEIRATDSAAAGEEISSPQPNTPIIETEGTGRDATDVPVHPLDDYARISNAVHGHEYHDEPTPPRMLRALRITSNLLRGERLPDTYEEWQHASGARAWVALLPGIGYTALRAIAPSTSDQDRTYLLTLLEVWSETVFADPTAELRIGRVETELPAVHTIDGSAVTISESHSGARVFVDLRRSESEPPTLGRVQQLDDLGPRWGDAHQLRSFIGLVRDNGSVSWDEDAVQLFSARTGVSRTAAVLVLAGYFGWFLRPKDELTTARRNLLGITLPAAVDAAQELADLDYSRDPATLFARVLPDNPAELWQPGAMRTVAERAAVAWVARYGCRATVPEPTLAAATAVRSEFGDSTFDPSAAELCAILAAPNAAPLLIQPLNSRAEKVDGRYTLHHDPRQFAFHKVWRPLIEASRWAYASLPAGDPVRAGVHRALELLRAQLRHPNLILGAPGYPGDRELEVFAQLSGVQPVADAQGGGLYDDGAVVAWKDQGDGSWSLHFRPAHFGFTPASDLLRANASSFRKDFVHLDWLFDPDCDRILARLAAADLPDGRYETEPTLCAPDLVDKVIEHLDLDRDAAVLYLQVLTLLNPTDRNIRAWNRWKPAHHKKVEDCLVAKGLLVRDSRKGAGRTVFLPGHWTRKPGIETWKVRLHNLESGYRGSVERAGQSTPRRAIPDLFHAAWQRTITGGVPT